MHPNILKVVKYILSTKNIGTMNSSDRLIFESKLKYEKFYQDIHNDYDYVYQSKPLTASINLMGKSMKEEFMFIQSHTKNF